MRTRSQRNRLSEWCDDHGGETVEVARDDVAATRCVLDSEYTRTTHGSDVREIPLGVSSRPVRDEEWIEIDKHGVFRASGGDTLRLTETIVERDADDTGIILDEEQHEIRDGYVDLIESLSTFGTLTVTGNAYETEDGVANRTIEADTEISSSRVSRQVITRDSMLDEWRADLWTEWKQDARAMDDPPELDLPETDETEWLQERGLLGEYERLSSTPDPDADPLPCPDGDVAEINVGDREIEGEISRIDCTDRETVIGVETPDGTWTVRGSPTGDRPRELLLEGRETRWDDPEIEVFETSTPSTK